MVSFLEMGKVCGEGFKGSVFSSYIKSSRMSRWKEVEISRQHLHLSWVLRGATRNESCAWKLLVCRGI